MLICKVIQQNKSLILVYHQSEECVLYIFIVISLPKNMRCKFQTKPLSSTSTPCVSDSSRFKALVIRYASNTELGVVMPTCKSLYLEGSGQRTSLQTSLSYRMKEKGDIDHI